MSNEQFTFADVQKMTFSQLGAIDDPMLLMATGHVSPIIARYVVRTGQLETRYPDTALPALLAAIDKAAAEHKEWPFDVGQKTPLASRDADVDAYLDQLNVAVSS